MWDEPPKKYLMCYSASGKGIILGWIMNIIYKQFSWRALFVATASRTSPLSRGLAIMNNMISHNITQSQITSIAFN